MRWDSFKTGLDILDKYFHDKAGFHIGAEHDQFYVYKTDNPMSDPDATAMRELGWFQEGANDGDPYDPENGWSCFT